MSNLNSNLSFLQGGGQMGAMARTFDWAQTRLGIPEQWPQNLRISVSVLLNSQFPMFVWWGKEQLITIYNDSYKIIAGDKHPSLFGQSGKIGWSEIWNDLAPLVEDVFRGNSTWSEDLRLDIFRHGTVEETYFTFSYSPILNDNGEVDGLFCAVVETTDKVFSKRKLEESKQDLAFAIEAAELATWDFNPIMNQFTADARFSELFGFTAHESTNNNLALAIIAEEDRGNVVNALSRAQEFSSGGEFDMKYTIRPANKPERILRAKGKSWFNDERIAYRITGTIQDITEQELSRYKIEESERNLRNIILQAPMAICILKGPLNIIEIANDRIIDLWGAKGRDIIGKSIFEVVPEVSMQGFEELLSNVYITGETYKAYGVPLKTSDNKGGIRTIYIDFVYEAYRETDNRISGIIVVAIDVTEQAISRKTIEEKSEELQLAIEGAELGSFKVNLLSGQITYSQRVMTWLGIPHENPELKDVFQLIHPEDLEKGIVEVQNAMKPGSSGRLNMNFRVIRSEDNSIRYFRSYNRIAFDSEGKAILMVGVVQDISKQMIYQENLKESEAELQKRVEERTVELAAANNELKRSNAQLEEFAHAASHDLKEPVRKIHFYTNQLKEQLTNRLTEMEIRSFSRIENATHRMGNLIDDLLLYSHVSHLPHEMVLIDLNLKVQNVLEDLELDIQEKNAVIHVDQLPKIWGYKRQIQQLFQNLLSNALKYSRKDVPPVINIRAEDESVNGQPYHCIRISDNGIGFESQYAEKIFQMFARLHGKNEYSGTGLGLSIVKKVVENHKGFITAKGETDKGSVFSVYFPAEKHVAELS